MVLGIEVIVHIGYVGIHWPKTIASCLGQPLDCVGLESYLARKAIAQCTVDSLQGLRAAILNAWIGQSRLWLGTERPSRLQHYKAYALPPGVKG